MSDRKPRQPLQWIQTVLLGIIITGGGALLKELRDDVKNNANTLIRVEERQTGVLIAIPKLEGKDSDLDRRELENERKLENHEYRIEDLEKKANGKQP